jgi:uncharacterized membrane protein HdeD (DUF308 family)
MNANINSVTIDINEMLHQHWRGFRNTGILLIVLGLLAIVLPMAAALAVDLILGWLLLVGGVVQSVKVKHETTSQRSPAILFL